MGQVTVDSHHHLWDIDRLHYAWMPPGDNVLKRNYLPDDMRPLLERNGIDKTVLVQAHESLDEAKWLVDLAESGDFIAGAVVWVDLVGPGVGHVLDELMQRPGLVGVRHGLSTTPDQDLAHPPGVHPRAQGACGAGNQVRRPDQTAPADPGPSHCGQSPGSEDGDRPHLEAPIASGGMEPWATDIARVPRYRASTARSPAW